MAFLKKHSKNRLLALIWGSLLLCYLSVANYKFNLPEQPLTQLTSLPLEVEKALSRLQQIVETPFKASNESVWGKEVASSDLRAQSSEIHNFGNTTRLELLLMKLMSKNLTEIRIGVIGGSCSSGHGIEVSLLLPQIHVKFQSLSTSLAFHTTNFFETGFNRLSKIGM